MKKNEKLIPAIHLGTPVVANNEIFADDNFTIIIPASADDTELNISGNRLKGFTVQATQRKKGSGEFGGFTVQATQRKRDNRFKGFTVQATQ